MTFQRVIALQHRFLDALYVRVATDDVREP